MKTSHTDCANDIILDIILRSRLAATIVAANFSFCIPYAPCRPSATIGYIVYKPLHYVIVLTIRTQQAIDQPDYARDVERDAKPDHTPPLYARYLCSRDALGQARARR